MGGGGGGPLHLNHVFEEDEDLLWEADMAEALVGFAAQPNPGMAAAAPPQHHPHAAVAAAAGAAAQPPHHHLNPLLLHWMDALAPPPLPPAPPHLHHPPNLPFMPLAAAPGAAAVAVVADGDAAVPLSALLGMPG